MKYLTKILFFNLSIFIFFVKIAFTYEIYIDGNERLSLVDIQSLTSIDLSEKNLDINQINILVSDIYKSDLIENISYSIEKNIVNLKITETKIIEKIYLNGNLRIKDNDIINLLSLKDNYLFSKNNLSKDINLIKNLYKSIGYQNINIITTTEKFNDDRINLIFNIEEGFVSNIVDIRFSGNNFFSDSYLKNKIQTKPQGFINIFSAGTNMSSDLTDFDINLISSLYEDYGFINAQITYELIEQFKSSYVLKFYIKENQRISFSDVEFNVISEGLSSLLNDEHLLLVKNLKKNSYFFDREILDKHIANINSILSSNSFLNHSFNYEISNDNENYILSINEIILEPIFVNQIFIDGNKITKDKTIRSKLNFEPGDYYNKEKLTNSKRRLEELKYINNVSISDTKNNDLRDIYLSIDENLKTGNILFAGYISGDTGIGFSFDIKDFNIFGSGNELNSSFKINTEEVLFRVSYIQNIPNESRLTNSYTIFNSENDLTDSFGFKNSEYGFNYKINYDFSKTVEISTGVSIKNLRGHSQVSSENFIVDNIGSSNHLDLIFQINSNTLDNNLYPTNGILNSFKLEYSPNEISSNGYYKINISNSSYVKIREDNFFFINNNIGMAESINGNLKTTNAFSLGGLNFKGFDYRGLGPFSNNIYLGGNKVFSSTVGYGANFIFDKQDNIYLKFFYSMGSIWDSDYTNDPFEIRSSAGLAMDFLTPVGPISLTYALPIEKRNSDKTREFNFSLGTSF